MRRGIDGALQLVYQFRNGAVQVVSNMANGAPIPRLPRMDPNGLKQHGGGDVVGVGDKWDRHPGTDGLNFRADPPRPPAGPGGENESARESQQEGEPDSQCAPPSFSHNSI